jgi:serine/threonine protein kinase
MTWSVMTAPGNDDGPATRGGYELPPEADARVFVGPLDDPDRYELTGPGRTGGEGILWRAYYHGQLRSPLPLAIKQLRPPGGAGPGWLSAAELGRLRDQIALLRHVQSDHLVRVHEIFSGPVPHRAGALGTGLPCTAYLVMEWVDGPTLDELCRHRPAATARMVRLRLWHVAQVAQAVAALSSHTRSGGNPSLHRDIKPANCVVSPQRGVVLVDTTTLRPVDDGFDPHGLHTPQYTAPEALAAPNRPRSVATEMYAVGALAAFCLAGRDPVPGEDQRAALSRIAAAAGIADPAALAAHIAAALDPGPHRRPANLAAWAAELVRLTRASRRGSAAALSAAIVALLLLLGAGFWYLLRPDQPAVHAIGTGVPSPSAHAAVGRILSPPDQSMVRQCAYFTGTATVPAGETLVLVSRNLDNHDPRSYVQRVFGWDDPARLSDWRGAQYFSQHNASVGQRFRIQLVAVPVTTARAYTAGDPGSAVVAQSIVLDQVELRRVTDPRGAQCPP